MTGNNCVEFNVLLRICD